MRDSDTSKGAASGDTSSLAKQALGSTVASVAPTGLALEGGEGNHAMAMTQTLGADVAATAMTWAAGATMSGSTTFGSTSIVPLRSTLLTAKVASGRPSLARYCFISIFRY